MLEIILSEFHPSTMWNGGIFIYLAFIAIIYFLILPSSKDHTVKKTIMFILGLVAIFVALGSPINILARIMFSSHIIQLILLLFIAPPLLIYGFKYKIFERLRKNELYNDFKSIVTKPGVAIVLFYGLLYGYHLPFIFNSVRLDLFANYLALFLIFLAAIMLFYPLVKAKKFSDKQKRNYILANIILILPYSIILMVVPEGIYALYSDPNLFMSSLVVCLPDADLLSPEFFIAIMPFNPVSEQMRGGILLLVATIAIFATIGFFKKKT